MQLRQLGSSDLKIPVLTLGTMTWGQQNNEEQAHEQLNYAVGERGLFCIDTAEIYPFPINPKLQGTTETYIGNWIKKRGKRDDLVLASKVAASSSIQTRSPGSPPSFSKKAMREALEGSLRRLQTDYLDLYQIHWPERNANFFGTRGYQHNPHERDTTPLEEVAQTLNEFVQEGLVRNIGVSNETPWGVHRYLRAIENNNLAPLQSIQNQYSLANRTFEIGLAEMTIKEKVGLLAYSVLNMGVLTGKYLDGAEPKDARFVTFDSSSMPRYNPKRAQDAVRAYVELAQKHDMDPATLAIAFTVQQPFVTSAIIGATNMEQLKVCIDAGEVTLSDEVLQEIEKIHEQYPDVTH